MDFSKTVRMSIIEKFRLGSKIVEIKFAKMLLQCGFFFRDIAFNYLLRPNLVLIS